MAQATEKEVRDLEKAMNEQFYYLVQGAAFRIAIARKYGLDSTDFKNYNSVFVPLVKSWILREIKYERENIKHGVTGIIASGDLKANDFYYSAELPKLVELVKKWNAEKTTSGIGFIPLLIWAVLAIVGAFTAVTITDDLTTTTQEKEELLRTTQQTAKDLGLTPEQAAGLITQTQAEASQGGITDVLKWGLLGVAAILVLPQLIKSTNK